MNTVDLNEQVSWDFADSQLLIGMKSKKMVSAWLEFLSCTELLPSPLVSKLVTDQVNESKPNTKYQIVSSCTLQKGTAFVAQLKIWGLSLTQLPPQLESTNHYKRGDLVQILFHDYNTKRINQTGVVLSIDTFTKDLEIGEIEGAMYPCKCKPHWVKIIGYKDLPPIIRWDRKDETAWEQWHLIANNIPSNIHIGKIRWESYAQELGAPDGKRFALFVDGNIRGWFFNLEDSQSSAFQIITPCPINGTDNNNVIPPNPSPTTV